MKLKANEPISEVFRLIDSGILDQNKYAKTAESFSVVSTSFRLFNVSLEQYQGFLEVANDDIKAVEYIFGLQNMIFNPLKLPIYVFFGWLNYLKLEVEVVNKLFDSIPRPEISPLVRSIMSDKRDFGIFAIIDKIACRQGLTDEQAGATPLIVAVAKMAIDAEQEVFKQRMSDAQKRG